MPWTNWPSVSVVKCRVSFTDSIALDEYEVKRRNRRKHLPKGLLAEERLSGVEHVASHSVGDGTHMNW